MADSTLTKPSTQVVVIVALVCVRSLRVPPAWSTAGADGRDAAHERFQALTVVHVRTRGAGQERQSVPVRYLLVRKDIGGGRPESRFERRMPARTTAGSEDRPARAAPKSSCPSGSSARPPSLAGGLPTRRSDDRRYPERVPPTRSAESAEGRSPGTSHSAARYESFRVPGAGHSAFHSLRGRRRGRCLSVPAGGERHPGIRHQGES